MMLLCLWQTRPFLRITVVCWVSAEVKLFVIYVLEEVGKKNVFIQISRNKNVAGKQKPIPNVAHLMNNRRNTIRLNISVYTLAKLFAQACTWSGI